LKPDETKIKLKNKKFDSPFQDKKIAVEKSSEFLQSSVEASRKSEKE